MSVLIYSVIIIEILVAFILVDTYICKLPSFNWNTVGGSNICIFLCADGLAGGIKND